jgi:DNA-binding Xre family transcriptional regulator
MLPIIKKTTNVFPFAIKAIYMTIKTNSLLNQIKSRRKALGLKQSDLILRVGMSRQQFQRLKAQGNPRLNTLELIALVSSPPDEGSLAGSLNEDPCVAYWEMTDLVCGLTSHSVVSSMMLQNVANYQDLSTFSCR